LKPGKPSILGVISDTHGLLRPEVPPLFKGVGAILHAGDIGSPEILESLQTIAPVYAVRGNNDEGAWARRIPESQAVRSGPVRIYLLHNIKELKPETLKANFHVVISGHSHRPSIEKRGETLFLNPGSAGPRRFKLPISLAKLFVDGTDVRAELIEL
jgi:uncharacterized protein